MGFAICRNNSDITYRLNYTSKNAVAHPLSNLLTFVIVFCPPLPGHSCANTGRATLRFNFGHNIFEINDDVGVLSRVRSDKAKEQRSVDKKINVTDEDNDRERIKLNPRGEGVSCQVTFYWGTFLTFSLGRRH